MSHLALPLKAWRSAAIAAALMVTACTGVFAQNPTNADYQALANNWVNSALATSNVVDGVPLRMEAAVGGLDSRLKLAPCGNVEVFLPPGARLWGKARVGIRCNDGMTRWNVSLPVTVKAFGKAWVVKNHVASGNVLAEADVVNSEVDWADESAPVLSEPSLWVGQIAARLLTTGQTLRQGMVKPAQVFQAGTQIRVLAQGAGFQVSADAQALSAGVVGQQARVRMDNGRIATGLVLDARTVKIDI
jgi:flagella basal body P-ring formation protein FlgA